MKSSDHFRSSSRFASGVAKTNSIPSRPSSDLVSSGSCTNLKLTSEKRVKKQASAKTDLELAYSKLKKLTEHTHALEEKLQNAFNENAKLIAKQKEDEKLWKGLESKFTSTKTFCDQLTETLQHLTGQVHDAEKDKEFLEDKLSASASALDNWLDQMKTLSLRLESSEETVRNRERELKELSIEKEEREKYFRDEQCKCVNLIKEKYALIKHLEGTAIANKMDMENLNSKMEELHNDVRIKEDGLKRLRISEEMVEKAIKKAIKNDLLTSYEEFAGKLDMALQEIENPKDFANPTAKFDDMDIVEQRLTISDEGVRFFSLLRCYIELVQEAKDLNSQLVEKQYDQLHNQSLDVASEKDALQRVNQALNDQIFELQRNQELMMVQHAEECCLAEERILSLESEAESLLSRKSEMELLLTKSDEKISTLSETSRLAATKMQDLLLKFSALESESKDSTEKLQEEIRKKAEEVNVLQRKVDKHEQHVDSLEKLVSQLQITLEEKEQLTLQYITREQQLEDQKAEVAEFVELNTQSSEEWSRKEEELEGVIRALEPLQIKKRRPVRKWSTLEVEALRKGVEQYGDGNWKNILLSNRGVFEGRIASDLSDKWRNLKGRK